MAAVYLAEELSPRRQVAIKVLMPDIETSVLRDRFLREVDLASKLVHPHIVPIFTAGEVDGLLYYVMPYIEGESLRLRLLRERVLPVEDAVEITRSVASALHYAHDLGIIHRDIKPENILFSRGHAMLADFGIAKALGPSGGQLTLPGHSVGTPAYMSPEQWAGIGEIDGRADVYSLGIVLLEMLGRPPAEAPPAERLRMVGESVRTATGSGKARRELVSVLERSLAIEPQHRLPTASALAEALRSPTIAEAFGRGGRRRFGVGALVGAAIVAVALIGGLLLPSKGTAVIPGRVLVTVFENQTGDSSLAHLGAMAADWITQGIAQTGLVEVVGTRTALGWSQDMPQSGVEQGQMLARETDAGIVVWGAYYRFGDTLRFQAQITDVREGRLLRALDPVSGPTNNPLQPVEELRQRVMGSLAVLMDQRLSSWASASSQPPSFEAYQLYVEGMTLFMQLNQPAAIPQFYRAAEADPTFVAPLLFAAFAHATLDQWVEADSLTTLVLPVRERLAPLDRFIFDWIRAMTLGDYEVALEAIRGAVEVAPGSEALLLQGVTALYANRPAEILDALGRLEPDRGFVNGFFIYWDYVTSALHMLGRHEEELEAAGKGRRQYPRRPSIVEQEARALTALARFGELDSVLDVMVSLPVDPRWEPGDAMRFAALEARAHGYDDAANHLLERSVAWYRRLPASEASDQVRRYGLARSLYQSGEFHEAQFIFEWLAQAFPDSVAYLGYQGSIAARLADRPRALDISASLEAFERPYLFGHVPYWQARIAAILGEQERAMALIEQARTEGLRFDPGVHFVSDLQPLRGYPPFEEWLRPK